MYESSTYSNLTITNPFPGLRSFQANESHLFFGRESHINDVLNKLESTHFVAIVGTSGTGKSSLIRAGVLPAFAKQVQDNGRKTWNVVSMTPGNDPIGNLANALADSELSVSESDKAEFSSKLKSLMRNNPLGLVQPMRSKISEGEKLLVLVDQFEEVFRFDKESEQNKKADYDAFVQIIIETVRQRDVPVYVILTLRSDFLGDCVSFEGLPEAINDGHYLVPRMNLNQLRRAITGPIELAKGKISPRLIQHVNLHLGDNADQLPILQHAMMRAWDYWKTSREEGEPMDLRHFEAIGGLENALSSHANEAFEELNEQQQQLCIEALKCLTTKQENNRGVRRPMSLENLVKITQSTEEEILACLLPFRKSGRNFILPNSDIEANKQTVFDISHESLMRGWDHLTEWVDEEKESADFYLRLCESAKLYEKGESALWRNPELQLALDWKNKQHPTKAWAALYNENLDLALNFLEQSRTADIIEKNKRKRRNSIIKTSVSVFILVISALAAWAMFQTNIANEKSQEAQQKSLEAIEQKSLAEKAKESAFEASNQAILAKENAEAEAKRADAQKVIADDQKRRAEIAAVNALREQKLALEQRNIADQKSQEAIYQRLQADSARNEALRLRMISIGQKIAYESGQIVQNPELASLLAINSFNIAKAFGGEMNDATLYLSSKKAMESIIPGYSSVVLNSNDPFLEIQSNSELLTAITPSGAIKSYSLLSFEETNSIAFNSDRSNKINTGYISASCKSMALGLEDFSVITNATDAKISTLKGHNGLVRAVCFVESDKNIITGGRDQKVIVWNNQGLKDSITLAAKIRAISSRASNNFSICWLREWRCFFI